MRRRCTVFICMLATCLLLVAGRYAIIGARSCGHGHAAASAVSNADEPVRYVCTGDNPQPSNACEASLRYSAEKLSSPATAGRFIVADHSVRQSRVAKPIPLGGPGPTTSPTCSETCTTCVGATCNVSTCPKFNTCQEATCMGDTCTDCTCPKYNTCAAQDTCDSPPNCCKPKCN